MHLRWFLLACPTRRTTNPCQPIAATCNPSHGYPLFTRLSAYSWTMYDLSALFTVEASLDAIRESIEGSVHILSYLVKTMSGFFFSSLSCLS